MSFHCKGEDIMNDKPTMTVQDIMDLGFSKWTVYNILWQAKHIMVERIWFLYNNKGPEPFPVSAVSEILGIGGTACQKLDILVLPETINWEIYSSFKAGVDLATGKPYQERRRGFENRKEALEARTRV